MDGDSIVRLCPMGEGLLCRRGRSFGGGLFPKECLDLGSDRDRFHDGDSVETGWVIGVLKVDLEIWVRGSVVGCGCGGFPLSFERVV
jgi:hypothetical protein